MRKVMIFSLIAAFGIAITGADIAEAKRFGMGSSFGKQRTINKTPQTRPISPQKQPAANSQRGSTRTGMMGVVGGLALGGLLGTMFFGGAFEGIKLFDILIIAAAAFLLLRLMRKRNKRRHSSHTPHDESTSYIEPSISNPPPHEVKPEPMQEEFNFEEEREPIGSALRPTLDEKHFTSAAKEIYLRMQKAWDSGDSEDIRKFCTAEIAERIGHDMSPNSNHHTEVVALDAEIVDSWLESDMEWVAVGYKGVLREKMSDHTGDGVEDKTAEVSETWIFRHTPNSDDPTWYLAGIQQAH